MIASLRQRFLFGDPFWIVLVEIKLQNGVDKCPVVVSSTENQDPEMICLLFIHIDTLQRIENSCALITVFLFQNIWAMRTYCRSNNLSLMYML